MKRIVVAAVLAAVIALAVAGPAVAFSTAPKDGAYVFPFDGGSWASCGGGGMIAYHDPGTPIQAGTDVYLVGSWIGFTKGLIKNIPDTLLYKATVNGAPGAGTYTGVMYQKFAHTTTDLMTGYYPDQHKPFMTRAGVTEFAFSFTIQ